MDDATSVLFDLPGFVVIECVELDDGARRVVIMQVAVEHGCPRCGVLVGGKPYDVRESRIKDLPFGERALVVIWRKRRYRCLAPSCRQKVFVERSSEIRPGRRSSQRLRRVLARADGQCRAYSQVAVEYGVSWWLVNDVATRAAAALPVEPAPVRWLGIDETRTRRPRWHHDPVTGSWWREEPWMTSLTNLDTSSPRAILGLTPGRSSKSVCTWLDAREQAWREGIEVVAIDPCAAYARAVRQTLPQATIVVDHFHLDRLANDMLTKVRRRVTWDNRDRRGRLVDPEWANAARHSPTAAVVAPAASSPAPPSPQFTPPTATTPYGLVQDGGGTRRSTKPLLMAISRQLEHQALGIGASAVVFTTLQHARNFTADTARRYAHLAADTAFVAVFATDLAAEPTTGVRGVALSHADPLTGEWSVIVIGPHFTGALLARDVGDTEADSARRFDYQVTYNRPTVLAAATLLMHHIPSSPTPRPGPRPGPLHTPH